MQWGAGPVTLGYAAPHEQFRRLVIHHTVVTYWGDPVAYMQRLQVSRPDLGLEVPYSFIVMPGASDNDAVIGVGRGWARTGAHTAGWNSTSYGVALAGDYTDHPPTRGMIEAIRLIGSYIVDPDWTLSHRQTYATACPGACTVPLMDQLQPPFPVEEEEEDMPTADEIAKAVWEYPIATRRGVFPAQSVLGWLKDEVTEDDLLLARIDAADEPNEFVGEGAAALTPDQIIDKLKERL